MSDFKLQRPAAYMELLQRFEEAKKSVSTKVRAPIVIRPPYAFIEHYLKYSDKDVSIFTYFSTRFITLHNNDSLTLFYGNAYVMSI